MLFMFTVHFIIRLEAKVKMCLTSLTMPFRLQWANSGKNISICKITKFRLFELPNKPFERCDKLTWTSACC